MLFSMLLCIYVLLIIGYIGIFLAKKQKYLSISIAIRLLTLLLFAFVIFGRYPSQTHLIILLLLWVTVEGFEMTYKKKIDSATSTPSK